MTHRPNRPKWTCPCWSLSANQSALFEFEPEKLQKPNFEEKRSEVYFKVGLLFLTKHKVRWHTHFQKKTHNLKNLLNPPTLVRNSVRHSELTHLLGLAGLLPKTGLCQNVFFRGPMQRLIWGQCKFSIWPYFGPKSAPPKKRVGVKQKIGLFLAPISALPKHISHLPGFVPQEPLPSEAELNPPNGPLPLSTAAWPTWQQNGLTSAAPEGPPPVPGGKITKPEGARTPWQTVRCRRSEVKISGFWAKNWNFQARLKRSWISSEIDNFKRATHQTPIFVGTSRGQDWNFQARLKFSSVQARLVFFKIRALWVWKEIERWSARQGIWGQLLVGSCRARQDCRTWVFMGSCPLSLLQPLLKILWAPPLKLPNTIVTEIVTKLISWEFSPVMFLSKITELIVGEFSSGNSLQDFVHGISPRVSWDRWTARCFR